MCGIIGYFSKQPGELALGDVVLRMLGALGCRGPDSTGVAMYGGKRRHGVVVRVKLAEEEPTKPQTSAILRALKGVAQVKASSLTDGLFRLELANGVSATAVERAVEGAVRGTEVFSIGRRLELVKRVGTAKDLDASYGVHTFKGTHFIGHTRLATESRVDISHSQPFWAHGTADLTAVHNGHITNYHRLRALYEMRGRRFYTENDSEIIPVYLADQMAHGAGFEEALHRSVRDLDGTFSYLSATADAFGLAKDFFSAKPLLMAETEEAVIVATEELAIQAGLGREAAAAELPARAVRVWSR